MDNIYKYLKEKVDEYGVNAFEIQSSRRSLIVCQHITQAELSRYNTWAS